MSDHIYKHIELTGSSDVGSDQAIRNAIAKAGKTVKKYGLVRSCCYSRLYRRGCHQALAGNDQDWFQAG
jgi:hypothetical protein